MPSLIETFTGQDAIVNCITGGATQYEPSKLIIDAAVAAGVKFFFANEFVGYVTSPRFRRMPEAYVGAKIRIREDLEELAAADRISWTSLNGGPFFDMWLMKGPAGFDVANRKSRIYGTGNNPLFWTPLPTIARAAGNMLRNPATVANKPIYICPFTKDRLTQRVILAAVEHVIGAPFDLELVDVEKINKNAQIALEKGELGKAMKGLTLSAQFCEDGGNDFSHLVENDLVGVTAMSVEDAVQEAIAKWGADCPVVEAMFRIEACEV